MYNLISVDKEIIVFSVTNYLFGGCEIKSSQHNEEELMACGTNYPNNRNNT